MITYAGHGVTNDQTLITSKSYAATARYESGTTKANAACQTDYNANPLYANTITSELFCFDGSDANSEMAQACEVRVYFNCTQCLKLYSYQIYILIATSYVICNTLMISQGDQGGPVVTGFNTAQAVLVGMVVGNAYNCIKDQT